MIDVYTSTEGEHLLPDVSLVMIICYVLFSSSTKFSSESLELSPPCPGLQFITVISLLLLLFDDFTFPTIILVQAQRHGENSITAGIYLCINIIP